MSKQISPDQALALSFTPFKVPKTDKEGRTERDDDGNIVMHEIPRFIKPGELQVSAMKRLRNHALGRTKQKNSGHLIPSFTPGVTTTGLYVATFGYLNCLKRTDSAVHLKNPAPCLPLGEPEVIIITNDETVGYNVAEDLV